MNLDVTRKSIPEVLSLLAAGEWQVPKFQREFVWSQSQVFGLLTSIFKARPIGMVTAWGQPQGRPQTPPEPLKLRNTQFGDFKQDPAIIKLILDGKQRLTILAIGFGGLQTPDDRYLFSGKWFLDFKANPKTSDTIVVYKKRAQIAQEKLDHIPSCIAQGLLPLDSYSEFNRIAQRIYDKDFYPGGNRPPNEELEERSKNLAEFQTTFSSYQIPVGELPASVGLAEVCEIFEVLNTTGTKVSTFDLIHNMVFGDTEGDFNLRERFRECAESPEKLELLCDEARPEFLCQLVTGCYITGPKPLSRRSTAEKEVLVTSIKGGDLIDTPTEFYETFFKELPVINLYANSLFTDVLRADFRLKEVPYPVGLIAYFAFRWKLDKHLERSEERYSGDELTRIYRAFFWHNALTNRYDQGFLTSFATDLRFLERTLQSLIVLRGSDRWVEEANKSLVKYFGAAYPRRTVDQLQEIVKDGEIRGALKQALVLYLNAEVKIDLVSGSPLNRFTDERNSAVDLHHIFPKQWCKDNRGQYPSRDEPTENRPT